jgi:hypothetical protein
MASEEEDGGMGLGSEEVCDLGSKDSVGDVQDTSESVLWMLERNEEDTGWVRPKDKEVASAQNKVWANPLPTEKQRKDLLVKKLVKKDNFGDADKWLREQVKDSTWDKCVAHFKGAAKNNSKQRCAFPLLHEVWQHISRI